ncbi:MAG: D-alanyl-D-alanine carboxypeptidase [Ruminococcaceae bacterium]|nr:D-alanyl-D-alanine carboxypeptidase [Oscillospiraceae bacterium]
MKKRIFSLFLIICLLLSPVISVNAYEITTFEVPCQAAALYSIDTKEIIYSKNLDQKVYPASMVQLMAAVVVLENCTDLENTEVEMTQSAYNNILGTGAAVMHLKVGEKLKCKDALAAMLISSAGDAIYAICEKFGGSIEGFVDMMNKKAGELGLSGTHYTNPIGLHDAENYTTVRDIIKLAEYAINKYPIFSELTGKSRYSVEPTNMSDKRTLVTTNLMVDSSTNYFYSYCTGTKTGFTDEAGRCLTATAQYKGYKYLAVLMNCPSVDGKRSEFITAKEMFRWVFNNFEYKAVLDTTVPVAEIKVRLSMDYDYVSLYPESQLTSILPKDADSSTVIVRPKLDKESVKAPIKRGDVLGTAEVVYAETVIGTVNLVAGNDINSNGLLVFFDFFRIIFTSLAFKIILGLLIVAALLFAGYVYAVNFAGKKKVRKVKYIPYDEEKERLQAEKRKKQREKDGRPELKFYDDERF